MAEIQGYFSQKLDKIQGLDFLDLVIDSHYDDGMDQKPQYSYWKTVWQQFSSKPLGMICLGVIILFCLAGIYAPLLANSKPLFVIYDGQGYFPLFRYLFFSGFFTKKLDLFFNLLMFTLPFFILFAKKKKLFLLILTVQIAGFLFLAFRPSVDPAINTQLITTRKEAVLNREKDPTWNFELEHMTPYQKLNALIRYTLRKEQHNLLQSPQTLWARQEENLKRLNTSFLWERKEWLEEQSQKISIIIMPLFSSFHWEDDAGGSQSLNKQVTWNHLTRINQKDLVAALIFGMRITIVVGVISIAIALAIGIPLGSLAGYYGGKLDILLFRLIEIWESMPIFFMLLLIVGVLQSKSIFLVIFVIGFFGWTGFSRYIRGEFFKQRSLPYIEACRSLGYKNSYIIFSHILPNAIPPLVTLLPFSIMGAITTEAGLSFLGLGEEGSCSWGVLMDEGRTAFPGESYLLWPPAILLTILLVSIAIVGDALRDAIDPKLKR